MNRISIERRLSQQDFDRFADLSGDDNPIHVDPAFSSRTRFGRTVAHGLLLCTVLRGLIEQLAPGARQCSQAVMFPAPTFADELMRFSAEQVLSDEQGEHYALEVRRVEDGVVTCSGHTVLEVKT